MDYYIEIVRYRNDLVFQRIGPYPSERLADKANSGLNRNLNHDSFYTRVVPATSVTHPETDDQNKGSIEG